MRSSVDELDWQILEGHKNTKVTNLAVFTVPYGMVPLSPMDLGMGTELVFCIVSKFIF